MLKGNKLIVADILADSHHRKWVPIDDIAYDVGKTSRAIKPAIKGLVESGLCDTNGLDCYKLTRAGRDTVRALRKEGCL